MDQVPLFSCDHADATHIGGTTWQCRRCGEWFDKVPAARTHDPITSKLAERQHTDSGTRHGHKERVWAVVKSTPGLTAREVADRIEGLGYIETMRRLADLADLRDFRARRGGKRKCSISKRLALTWWPRRADE